MKTYHRSLSRTAIAFAALAALPAYATNGTWNQTAAGTAYTWNTPANWGGTTPNAISDTATLNTALAGNQTISLGGTNVTLGSLSLGATTGTFTYTLATGTFTLNNNGGGAAITELSNTSNGDTISTSIVLADTLSNTISSNSTLATSTFTISGGITGAQPLTLAANNAGNIKLSGTINNTGNVTNSGTGTNTVFVTTAFGNNVTSVTQNSTTSTLSLTSGGGSTNTLTFNINNGTLVAAGGNAFDSNSSIVLANTAGATFSLGGTGVTIGSLSGGGSTGGNVTHTGGAITLSGTNVNATFNGGINGNAAVTTSTSFTGTQTFGGTWVLNASGASSIQSNGGTIVIGSTAVIGTATNNISSLTTTGSGSLIIQNGASIPKGSTGISQGSTGTFTINGTIAAGQGGTVSNGVMQIGATGNLSTSQGLTVNGGTFTEISGGNLSNANGGGLTVTGNGTAIMNSSANTYTAGTTVSQGVLQIGVNAPSGAVGALGNATGAVTLGALNTNSSGTLTGTASILTNTGGVTFGRGISVVGTNNTGTFVSSTGLVVGGIQTSGTSTYTGAIAMQSALTGTFVESPALTLTSAAGGAVNFAGAVTGTNSVIISGGGLVQLTGTNTFGGASNTITIQSGTLTSGNAGNNLGNASNILAFKGGSYQYGTGTSFDLSTRTIGFLSAGGTIDTNGNTVTFGNAIGNGGTGSYTGGLTVSDSVGTGTLILGAANNYSGGTTVAKGTLETTAAGALGSTSAALAVNTNGNLDLHGTAQTVGNLSGTGGTIYNNGSGTSTLTIGNGNANGGSYAGVIENNTGSGGITALTKTGTGTLILTGANTYTGATTIGAGSLNVAGGASLGATAVSANNGGTLLIGTGGSAVAATIGSGGSLTVNTGGALTFTSGIVGGSDSTLKNLNINGSSGTGLTFTGGTLNIGLGGGNSDEIVLGSGLGTSLSGAITINLNVLSTLSTGSIQLISYGAGATNSNSATYSIVDAGGVSTSGDSFSIVSSATGLYLDVSATSFAYWKGAGTSWSSLSNFTTDSGGTTPRTAALDGQTTIVFTATGGSNYANTTLDGTPLINNLVLNVAGVGISNGNSSSNSLTIGGSTGISVGSGVGSGTDTISANVVLAAAQTWTVSNAASTLAVSGNVTGSASLVKAGSGTLVLSGVNGYTGPTTVTGGYLNIQSSDALDGTGTVTVNSGAALQMQGGVTTNNSTSLTLNGTGPGTAGALESRTDGNSYTGAISLSSASSIGSDTGNFLLTGPTITNNGNTLTLVGAGNGYISDVISGSGGLTMNGTGLWILDANNTYTGTNTINSGTIQISTVNSSLQTGATQLGATTNTLAVNGGTLDMAGWTLTIGNLTGSSGTITNSQPFEVQLTLGTSTNSSFGGSIIDNAPNGNIIDIIKSNSGTQTLTGSNSYGGYTSVTAGALNIAGANALSANSAVSVSSGAALQLSGGVSTKAASLSLVGAGTTASSAGALENVSGNNSYTGAISLLGATSLGSDSGTLTLGSTSTITGSNTNLTLVGAGSGVISDVIATGSGNVTMNGTGTWTLSGSNSYTGATNVNAGTLDYKVSALQSSSAINIGSSSAPTFLNYAGAGGTLTAPINFSGSSPITLGNVGTGSITYTGSLTFAGSNITLDLGNSTDTIGGTIGNIVNATGFTTSLVKNGATNSMWVLSGSNTYTGATTINGGILQVASQAALGTGNLNLNGSSTSLAVLQTNGTVTLNGTTGQTLSWGGFSGFASNGGTLTLNISNGVPLAFGGGVTGDGSIAGGGGSNVAVFGTSTATGTVLLANNINLNSGDPYQMNFYVLGAGETTVLSGTITNGSGAGAASGLNKIGNGTLVLTNANSSYSGYTSILGGTLVAEASSTITVANSTAASTGVFGSGNGQSTAPSPSTFAPILLGSTLGGGGQSLGGIINPTLMVGSPTVGGSTSISNPVSVNWSNGTGQVYGIGGYTDSNNTFAGLITLNGTAATGNSFAVTQVATTGSDALNITGGITTSNAVTGTVNFNNVGAVNVSTTGISNGPGASTLYVTQNGTGTTTFSAANTYTGATTVNAGLLRVNGSLVSGSAVTVNSGGALGGTGTISGAVSVNAGGSINLADGTIGTLTVGSLTLGTGSTAMTFDIGAGSTNNLDLLAPGSLTVNGTSAITIGFVSGSPLLTAGTYTLISGNITGLFGDFSLTDSTLGNYAFQLVNGGASGLELQVTSNLAPTTYFYTGTTSTDFTDYHNFTTGASNGTTQTVALSSTSDVTIGSTSPTPANLTPVANSNMSIDSLTFASSGSGATLSGTGTVTIAATGNGGIGIADNAGIATGTETVATALVLGSNQTWSTSANSTLRVSGAIGGSQSLALTGAGTYRLAGANTFSGLTVGTGSDTPSLYLANGTNGSATGTTTVTVKAGATLGGKGTSSGTSFTLAGTGTATSARVNVIAGLTSVADTNTTGVLTLKGSAGISSIADANLTFNLDATSTSSTQLNVGATNVAFGTDNIGSVKLTLNVQNEPAIIANKTVYTLIAGTGSTGTTPGSSTGQYTGLTLGATTTVGGVTQTVITGNNLQLAFGSQLDQSYYGNGSYLVLYQSAGVDDIDVVVVPEPGTWAMMIGGLAVLFFWQRRRSKA